MQFGLKIDTLSSLNIKGMQPTQGIERGQMGMSEFEVTMGDDKYLFSPHSGWQLSIGPSCYGIGMIQYFAIKSSLVLEIV